jgi:hypothetical protein
MLVRPRSLLEKRFVFRYPLGGADNAGVLPAALIANRRVETDLPGSITARCSRSRSLLTGR